MTTYYVDPVNGNDANDGGGWWKLALASGVGAQPVAGETATGAGGATGKVIKITGTWATSPTVYLYNRNGTAFANGEAITFSGGGSCVNAQGTPYDAIVASFKTIHKTFAAGDIINVAKCAETAQSGTATATKGSVSVTGISGWTPAQYDITRFDTDDTLYMVKAYSSGTITLYRPYRGTTGSGKVISKLTLHVLASDNDLNPTGGTGTISSYITLNGGIDLTTNTRIGFSIWSGNYSTFRNNAFWNTSYVGFYNISQSYNPNPTDCIYNNIFLFRFDLYYWFYSTNKRNVFNNPVIEGGGSSNILYGTGNIWNNPEIAGSNANLLQIGPLYGSVINNLILTPSASSQYSLTFNGTMSDVVFVDPNLDELLVNSKVITTFGTYMFRKFIIKNPKVGTGTLFSSGGYSMYGEFSLENVNGDVTKQYNYYGIGEADKYFLRTMDDTTYHTAAPSAKISLFQSVYPVMYRHYIPCDAGVAKTISVYFRKNSSYGSVTLPIMRLRWMTGTAPALVSNVHDVTMVDTNDTFLQYSYAVTPSIDADVIVELIFQSANSGAIAWYDDLVKT